MHLLPFVRLGLMLQSYIFVTMFGIKYAQLPVCPAILIYSMATVSVSRHSMGQKALNLIKSLLM